MTDRMFLVEADGWLAASAGDEVEVSGAEGRHAVAVVKVRPGETVLLGGGGRRAEATVTHTAREAFSARLDSLTDEPEPEPRFVLVQALAKGGRDEQAVETATELGVDEVVPWQSARGVVVWRGREREERGRRRWESVCVAATKQSRRARVPVVAAPATTDGRRRPGLGRGPRSGPPRGRDRPALRGRGPHHRVTSWSSSVPRAASPKASWPPWSPRAAARSGSAPRCCAPRPPDRPRSRSSPRPVAGGDDQPTENGTMFWKAMLPSFMLISIARNSYRPAASVPRSTVHEPCCGQPDVAVVWPCFTTEPP